jgi:putative hydrolase of the HAD superfamily
MIKNIIFDFGGILLDLDFKKTDDAMKALFHLKFEHRAYPAEFLKIFNDYEQGFFSEGSYFFRLQQLADHLVTERQLLDAWNAMLLNIPQHRLNFLLALRKKYKVYLLSNTNHTHIQWVHRFLKREYNITDFEARYFDHAYYSHDLKMRKPNHDIYQAILSDANINGAESLFIDDIVSNITAAQECGIQTAHHDPNEEIVHKLEEYIRACV